MASQLNKQKVLAFNYPNQGARKGLPSGKIRMGSLVLSATWPLSLQKGNDNTVVAHAIVVHMANHDDQCLFMLTKTPEEFQVRYG